MSVSARHPRRRALPRSGLGALATAFLLALAIAGPALAHADLASSTPADKAVLADPPRTVTLTFTEALDPAKSSFRLNGAGGTIGIGRVAGADTVMTLETPALAPGAYEIQWTAAATDGHIERGTLTFILAQRTTPPSSSGPTSAPVPPTASAASPAPAASAGSAAPASAASAGSAAPATPASTTQPPGNGADPVPPATPGDVLLPILVALAAVAGVGAYLLRRSRRA